MKPKQLKEKLEYKPKNAWGSKNIDHKEINKFAEGYIKFISDNKTEREVVEALIKIAEKKGFKEKAGDTFYMTNKGKNIALVKMGKNNPAEGIKLIVSHMDSPRLDLKQNPLYEDTDIAFLKTHYYGGIKNYQWLARPLAIHGIVILGSGKEVNITIGEDDKDPVFFIADLLPHLSHKKQDDKKFTEAFPSEKLNVIIGSLPFNTDEEIKDKVKLGILDLLHKKYKITEKDFQSAEIEIVPAGKAREAGFDRSLVVGYGQDDRVCVYATLEAIINSQNENDTVVALFSDKEEIGSDGNTGAKSVFLKQVIKQVFISHGSKKPDMLDIEDCLYNSKAVSADVNGALDPDWKEVHEERNAAKMGYGVCMTKFTGSRGKAGASDANAEYVGILGRALDKEGIVWQTGELGKIDEGGGGTIAKFIASYGMEVIDMGPALLSMHAPIECASKVDIYMTYKAYKVFYEKV